jgi:hypothetical protein
LKNADWLSEFSEFIGEKRPFHRLVFEDDVTSHERWLDIVHLLQSRGRHDCAIDLLISVTAIFAIKEHRPHSRPLPLGLTHGSGIARRRSSAQTKDSDKLERRQEKELAAERNNSAAIDVNIRQVAYARKNVSRANKRTRHVSADDGDVSDGELSNNS